MATLHARRWLPLAVAAAYVAGCGLISSDITRLTFDLPNKTYVFSTASAQLPATGTLPQVACTTDADCCALPGINCATTQLACTGGQCAIEQPVTVSQTMNLGQEVSQLHGAQSLADIFISEITYTVASTLNTALPPITLYLAPNGVVDPKDPSAKKFGTVPATAAGANASGTVALESDSQQTFSSYAEHLDTPFNFIATTTVVVAGGAPIPNGQVTVSVTGKVSVQAKL
jgi:hypothetical protein